MRRTRSITLTLLAMGSGLALAACDSAEDGEGVASTEAACVERLGADAAAECHEVFRAAAAEHLRAAPRFADEAACRAETGAECVPDPSAKSGVASAFLPVMTGVMIGRLLSDGTRGALPVYAGRSPPLCPPGVTSPSCLPPTASSSAGAAGGGGRAWWYSGGSYAGSSTASSTASSTGGATGGFRPASASEGGAALLARSASRPAAASVSATGASRAGGFGFSARAHSGGGS